MSSVTTLFDFATELLTEAQAALATTAAGVPSRAYVAASLPALDCCPQLTVHVQDLGLEATTPGSPGPVVGHRTQQGQLNLTTLVIQITRCTPQPTGTGLTAPTAEALTALSFTVLEDVWAIWNWLTRRIFNGELFEGKCMAVYLETAIPIDEAGQCAGWQIIVRPSIQGYVVGP